MWLTQAKTTHECVAGLIRTIRHDAPEETKGWAALGRGTAALESRARGHAEWAEWWRPAETLRAMVDLIRRGGAYEGQGSDALEAMWRECSAAALAKGLAMVNNLEIDLPAAHNLVPIARP